MIVNAHTDSHNLPDTLVPEDLTRITARGVKLSGPDFLLQAQQVMRKPLSVIQNLPGWILDEHQSDEEDAHNEKNVDNLEPQLNAMALQARRVQRIMEDMVAFDTLRYHVKSPETFSPHARLTNMINNKFPDGPGEFTVLGLQREISADIFLFDCLFGELLDNAVIHSETPETSVMINIDGNNSHIRIMLSDNGVGIPQIDHQRIFQPFAKLSDAQSYETSGLGLAKVVRAAGLLGGAVDIGSRKDPSGTIMLITLPTGLV